MSHLLYFDRLIPDELYDIVISRIKSMNSIDINSLMCIRLLIESGRLDITIRDEIIEHLIPLIKSELKKEEKWDGSGIYPLVIARFPGDVFENAVTDRQIQEHFKYDIESQNEDGSWPLNWDWSDVDEKLWSEAEKEWKGVFILQKLRVWKAYNR